MAFATVFSIKRSDVGTVTNTPLTRGLVLNGFQTEEQVVTKLTGDTTGTLNLSTLNRPSAVYALVLNDSAGAAQASLSISSVTFVHVDADTVTLSGMGNWTRALLIVTGRASA